MGCAHIRGERQAVWGCVSRGSHRSPKHCIPCPVGLQLCSGKKASKRSLGLGSWAEPAPRKVGRAVRRICNSGARTGSTRGNSELGALGGILFHNLCLPSHPCYSIPATGSSVHPLGSFPNLPSCFCGRVLCAFLISCLALHLNNLGFEHFS